MTKVVLEKGVVHVVVSRRTKAEFAKEGIPRKNVLAVNQGQPTGVAAPKGHVAPNIASAHEIGRNVQWNGNHEESIRQTAIERVKQAWIDEFVVRFVRHLVKGGRNIVFQSMHDVLDAVLNHQTESRLLPLNATFKPVIRGGHEVQHPGKGEVAGEQDKPFGLGNVRFQPFTEFVHGRSLALHARRNTAEVAEFEEVEKDPHKELSHRHGGNAQGQAERFGADSVFRIVGVPFGTKDACVVQWGPRQSQRQR